MVEVAEAGAAAVGAAAGHARLEPGVGLEAVATEAEAGALDPHAVAPRRVAPLHVHALVAPRVVVEPQELLELRAWQLRPPICLADQLLLYTL